MKESKNDSPETNLNPQTSDQPPTRYWDSEPKDDSPNNISDDIPNSHQNDENFDEYFDNESEIDTPNTNEGSQDKAEPQTEEKPDAPKVKGTVGELQYDPHPDKGYYVEVDNFEAEEHPVTQWLGTHVKSEAESSVARIKESLMH